MKVDFTPDQEALIRQAIASGRYHTAEDAVHDAMARWEETERSRIEMLATSCGPAIAAFQWGNT
jgi:Arc/MetJ-type ribon-helix-helix transcriptional regulator